MPVPLVCFISRHRPSERKSTWKLLLRTRRTTGSQNGRSSTGSAKGASSLMRRCNDCQFAESLVSGSLKLPTGYPVFTSLTRLFNGALLRLLGLPDVFVGFYEGAGSPQPSRQCECEAKAREAATVPIDIHLKWGFAPPAGIEHSVMSSDCCTLSIFR